MEKLIYSIAILLISHSIVLAQPNEYLTFEDNQVPAGWTFTPINSADISNGRLNAYTNDGRAKLSKSYTVESETQGFTIEWDAFVAYSFWGMGTHFSVFKGNERFIFSHQVEDNDYAADDLHLQIRYFDGTNQSLINEENIKFNEGVYHFKLVVDSSGYKFECFEEDNNEALQSLSLSEPENYFHFADIDSILIDTYAHTDNNAWTDNVRITINSPVSIEENSLFKMISIFPNPNAGLINIDFGNLRDVSITVFSVSGQLIYYKENISDPTYQFELNEVPGIYILELSAQGEKQYYKLVKK